MRAGRFDKVIYIGLPGLNARKEILNYYLKKIKYYATDENLEHLARKTINMTGADIKTFVNLAKTQSLKLN